MLLHRRSRYGEESLDQVLCWEAAAEGLDICAREADTRLRKAVLGFGVRGYGSV